MRKNNKFIDKIDGKFRDFKGAWKSYFNLDFFDSMNLLLFILGSILLVTSYLKGISHLSELITAEILFLTFIAILQYTKETYWLKKVQEKTLNQERVRVNYEVMPYLELAFSEFGEDTLRVLNKGNGLARDIDFNIKIGDERYSKKFFVISNQIGGGGSLDPVTDERLIDRLGEIIVGDAPVDITVDGKYFDITNREYSFHMIFRWHDDLFELTEYEQKPKGWSIKKGLY